MYPLLDAWDLCGFENGGCLFGVYVTAMFMQHLVLHLLTALLTTACNAALPNVLFMLSYVT
jgi:hypothetical protein